MSSAILSEILDALDDGAQLLLPNARAAHELRRRYDARQRLRGLAAWEPPRVLSWSQWTNSLWSELVVAGVETRLLLNEAQEQSLWRQVLAKEAEKGPSGPVEPLAELARSAWQLAAEYNALHRLQGPAAAYASYDSRVFAGWAETFSARCTMRGYLSAALLDDALLRHVNAGALAAPGPIELIGFHERLPSQDALLNTLREHGTEVLERRLEQADEGESLRASVVAADERDELLLAARWIRERLKTWQRREGGPRIAVLVPNLSEERAELEEVLREALAPELQEVGADMSSTPWEFSGGVPLASLDLIGDALALLRWANGPLPLARVSPLLLSPYLGENGTDGEQRDASARFDAGRLRGAMLLRPEIEIGPMLKLAVQVQHGRPAETSPLLAWLHNVQTYLQRNDRARRRGFAEWMEYVRGLTRAANWPGDRALTATEFEATRAWESVLDLVSTLDFDGRRVAYEEALQALDGHARTSTFAPPSTGAPVQVMSVAEAQGSLFDAAVCLRSTDANLPAMERANPLLPWALQRSLNMPGSDPASSAAKSLSRIEDLSVRSGSVLFTLAAEDSSGKLRPSPLLDEMKIERMDAATMLPEAPTADPLEFEVYVDDSELPKLPSREVSGGAAVLKLQAACGFLAFATMRLHASEPKGPELGLGPRESGTLLHRALQHFWKEVGSQASLRLKSWAERDAILARCIEDAMPRALEIRDNWDRAYLTIQKERLRSVLQEWLDVELQRGPFTVLAEEQSEAVDVGPLTLSVRMDRIDRVGEGFFYVDYKTGYAGDPKQWEGERPDEPQLPLYALLTEPGELKGLAFAKVRAGREMKWAGYQSEEGILSVRSRQHVEDLVERVEQWRKTLTQLAEDFASGRADVQPKDFEVNCSRCAQRLLCRIDPDSLGTRAVENTDDVEDMDG